MSESADLGGLRAVVTGATSGLGAAMADALLEAGATVAMAARPGLRLDEAVARRTQRGLATAGDGARRARPGLGGDRRSGAPVPVGGIWTSW